MKYLITSLVVAITMVGSSLLLASPGSGGKRFDDCRHSERFIEKDSTRQNGNRVVERLSRKLDLNQEQNSAVKDIVEQTRPQMQQLRDKLRENHKQLQSMSEQDVLDVSALQQLAEQQGRYKAEMIVLRTKMRSEIYQQLNDSQRQQFKDMRKYRKNKRY